jgi:putative NADH-flavin reductase
MRKQKLIIFGGAGKTVNNLIVEALNRKYLVTAIVYDITKIPIRHPDLEIKHGHMMNTENVETLVKTQDAVIAVHEPLYINPKEHVKAIYSVINGVKKAGVRKLLVIGHPIYCPIENTMEFYDLWKPIARAQQEVLALFHRENYLNWAYVYSNELQPDPKTGRLDKQGNMILASPLGESLIPLKGYAPILLDYAQVLTSKLELELNI